MASSAAARRSGVPAKIAVRVALAAVAELPAGVERVDRAQEQIVEPPLVDDRGIEGDLDRLVMARAAAHDLLVGRVLDGPAGVAGDDLAHALDLLEIRLDAPEAAARDHHGVHLLGVRGGGEHDEGRGGGEGAEHGGSPLCDASCGELGAPRSVSNASHAGVRPIEGPAGASPGAFQASPPCVLGRCRTNSPSSAIGSTSGRWRPARSPHGGAARPGSRGVPSGVP